MRSREPEIASTYDAGMPEGTGGGTGTPKDFESQLIAQQELAAIVESSADAIFRKDLNGMIERWNAGAERMYGYSAEEIIGTNVSILIPDHRQGEELSILERLSRGERIDTYETERVRKDGVQIDVALTVSPIMDSRGRPIGGAITAREITGAKRRRQAMEFLAHAVAVFDASLDPLKTLRTVAASTVPALCELCVIDLLTEDGSFAGAIAAASDPGLAAEVEEVRRSSPLDPNGKHPVAEVMRVGHSMLWHDLSSPETMTLMAQSEDHRRLLERAGYRSAAVAPMQARGRTFGAISLIHVLRNQRYDEEDLALVDEIAARAAMALDNARLYAERDHIAAVLQRGLVPERPAEVPGFEIAVAFEPAGEGVEVGGDFFDVITRDHDALVIVGDVSGRGSEAVALTSLVRHSSRAFALDLESPAEILRKVNAATLAQEAEEDTTRFVTAIIARLEHSADAAHLAVCSAGHPPAMIVRRDGRVELAGRGALLGVFAHPELSDEEVILERGDTAILYTDGLLEAGATTQHLSVDDLAALLADSHELPTEKIVARLRENAFSRVTGVLTDDLLVLAVRFTGGGTRPLDSDLAAELAVPGS
jgi:PAS domain S-box-containing protein